MHCVQLVESLPYKAHIVLIAAVPATADIHWKTEYMDGIICSEFRYPFSPIESRITHGQIPDRLGFYFLCVKFMPFVIRCPCYYSLQIGNKSHKLWRIFTSAVTGRACLMLPTNHYAGHHISQHNIMIVSCCQFAPHSPVTGLTTMRCIRLHDVCASKVV